MNAPLRLLPIPASEAGAAAVRLKLAREKRWMAVIAAASLGIGLTQGMLRPAATAMPMLAVAGIVGALAFSRHRLERLARTVEVDHVFGPRELEIRYRVGSNIVVERYFLRRIDMESASADPDGIEVRLRTGDRYRVPPEAIASNEIRDAVLDWVAQPRA